MKKIIICLTAVICLKGISTVACDCAPQGTVREAYNSSAAVYTAYVQSISTQPDSSFPGNNRSAVKTLVRQNWKGLNAQSEAIIYTAKDASLCGYDFRVGQTYLIYGYVGGGGLLNTSYCGRTKHISEASEDIEEIKRIAGH